MAHFDQVLDMPQLGARVELRRTGAQTDGELLGVDVIGRPRGIVTQAHVHLDQRERHEAIEGSMRLVLDGTEHVLEPGQSMDVPAGTRHRQRPGGSGAGRVRVQLRPTAGSGAVRADARRDRLSRRSRPQ